HPRFLSSSRRRHTRSKRDWSSDVCSSDLGAFHALRDLSEERVREIIEEAAADAEARDPHGEQVPDTDHARVGALYRMFMDTEAIERAGLAVLEDLVGTVGSVTVLAGMVLVMAVP